MFNSDGINESMFSDEDSGYEKNPKRIKHASSILALVLFAVAGTFLVQNTLAANISLNSGGSVEFGQGISQTTACSGTTEISMTPVATFVNESGSGSHKFASITVSNIPIGCYGSDFTINAYGDTDSTPLALFNTTSSSAVIYNNSGTFELGKGSTGMTISGGSDSFTVTFTVPSATTSSVYKLTLQSGAHTNFSCVTESNCELLGAGPGGGVIYYYSATPFACGASMTLNCNYLEVAPALWNGGSADPQMFECYGIGTDGQPEVGKSLKNTIDQDTGCRYWGVGYTSYDLNLTAERVIMRYSNNGVSDWAIPSFDALNELCKYARNQVTGNTAVECSTAGTLRPGFTAGDYSSSTSMEGNKYRRGRDFLHGGVTYHHAFYGTQYIRPVRAF